MTKNDEINLRNLFKNDREVLENQTYENYKKEIKIKNEKINFKNMIDECYTCLSVVIQRLAESNLPLPILSRIYPTIWLSKNLKKLNFYAKNSKNENLKTEKLFSNTLIFNQNSKFEFENKVYIYAYIYTCLCTTIHEIAYMYLCLYVCIYMLIPKVCIYMYSYIHIIYTYIHIYFVHIYIYTYIYLQAFDIFKYVIKEINTSIRDIIDSIHNSAGLATACKIPTGKKTVNFLSYPAPEFSKNINIEKRYENNEI
jgi:hypothetical protein